MWKIRLLWQVLIECRVLGKHSESERHDVYRRTEGVGMVCTSWGCEPVSRETAVSR